MKLYYITSVVVGILLGILVGGHAEFELGFLLWLMISIHGAVMFNAGKESHND